MQQKTSSALFEKYGTVYEYPLELENTDRISTDWHIIAKRNISSVYCFDREVFLEMQEGMAALIVSDRL